MTRTQLQEIMIRAHEIARTCEGDYAAGLSYGLRQAWAEYRLLQLGNRWTKAGHDRIYFNDLPSWFGLEISRYKTGNIFWATLNGEKISNNSARRYLGRLAAGKVWYDLATGQFGCKNLSDEDANIIIERIRAAARVA